MKRKIKFRGKRKYTGEWMDGTPVYYKSGEVCIYPIDGMPAFGYECTKLCRTPVDPETVGQFTGLVDKNGKKVYEGDIVNFEWSDKNDSEMIKHEVIFKDGEFRMKPMKSLMETWEIRISNYANQIEIIGNIHENPELIKP